MPEAPPALTGSGALAVAVGQHSDRGRKPLNQDFHGVLVPEPALLRSKGIAVALADGISGSAVSHIAAEMAVKSFLTDYYATAEAWSVKTSAQRVIAACNSWLHAETRRGPGEADRGYVCTFSTLVLKSATAHLFHVGDARIWRLSGGTLEQLTEDHRVVLSSAQSYLGRALGARREIDIDYQALPIAAGDVFVLTTDGVHEHLAPRAMAGIVADADDLDAAARALVDAALAAGSDDNLTAQVIRIEAVPAGDAAEAVERAGDLPLPLPPVPVPGQVFDGWRILRALHASSRSHAFLAEDTDGRRAVLKLPSVDLRGEPAYLRHFMMEEWIAGRIDSPHVLKPHRMARPRGFLYLATEYVDGQTLAQWMRDNPAPELERVRDILEQAARGLRAFHRREMLHQDLRPENIMIDAAGTVRIIDFGAVHVAGVAEAAAARRESEVPGALQYAAPEYFLGEAGTTRSDLFSLGVIAYQMLTGRLPYGAAVPQARTRAQQRRLRYRPAAEEGRAIPAWVDRAIEKAVSIDPARRQEALSEFLHDLRHPNPALTAARPLLARNPVLVWQCVSGALLALVLVLLWRLSLAG